VPFVQFSRMARHSAEEQVSPSAQLSQAIPWKPQLFCCVPSKHVPSEPQQPWQLEGPQPPMLQALLHLFF
jgi:hypothetical protein